MKVGCIVNGVHPLLQTIASSEIASKIALNQKVLIIGMDEAIAFDPTITLFDTNFSQKVGYCFSPQEGKENYQLTLDAFVTHCVESVIKDYTFHFISDTATIKWTDQVFKFETPIGVYIANESKEIYYLNKQFMGYFNKELDLETPKGTLVWQWEDTFSALLQSTLQLQDHQQLYNILSPYCDINKYFVAFCMEWMKVTPKESDSFELWKRAYKVENHLSTLKVRLNVPLLEELSENNSILQAVLDRVEGSCVVQHYKGTDKTTGRIFPRGDGFSLQTFPHELRNLVVADEHCLLVEFDYQHFEYSLLAQIIGLKIAGDPHKELAKLLFNDESKRPIAKTINYGLLYGRSLNTLVIELINEYKVPYTKEELYELLKPISEPVEQLSLKLQKYFDEHGFIKNHFNREVTPTKRFACVNNYISSTATDYMIIKIEKLMSYLESAGFPNRIVLQNHDSILINLSIKDIENTDIALDILNILEGEEKGLTTKVDLKHGINWAFTN